MRFDKKAIVEQIRINQEYLDIAQGKSAQWASAQ